MENKIYVAGSFHDWRKVDLNINTGLIFQGAMDYSDGFLPAFYNYSNAAKAYPNALIFEMTAILPKTPVDSLSTGGGGEG